MPVTVIADLLIFGNKMLYFFQTFIKYPEEISKKKVVALHCNQLKIVELFQNWQPQRRQRHQNQKLR